MKKMLIEIDEATAARLEAVAPARSRRRSEFVRMAIRQALWELEEKTTEAAYAKQPDDGEAWLDPRTWDPEPYPQGKP